MPEILFLCNRKRCGPDHDCGECRHTLNPEYAVNFTSQTYTDPIGTERTIYVEDAHENPDSDTDL